MKISDVIQIAILIVLAGTLIFVWRQHIIQNRVLKAQILRDRLEMYWKTYQPVSDEEVKEFHLLVEDYMDKIKYENNYKDNDEAIRKYITLLRLYEYLAFTYSLKRLKLPDPLGGEWTEHWIRDLFDYKEFLDVHEYHKYYYPEFRKFIDKAIQNQKKL
jgi:hypothetical protein